MKLAFSQIVPLLKNPPQEIRVFLLFGPDAGLVHERAEDLASKLVADKKDPFAVYAMSGSELGNASAKLLDEMAALPLTGGRKLVRVYQATESNAGPLSDFIKNPNAGDSVLLIEANELQTKSKLRSVCEGKTQIATAIPCYYEDNAQRQKTISNLLQAEQLTAPHDVIALLADLLPPDRMALHSEIEKLALYARGQGHISFTDVKAVIAEAGGAEIDDFIEAVASGDPAQTTALLDFLTAEQTPAVTLLRAMQRHLMRLHIARSYIDQGETITEAIKKLVPPVFWKSVPPMTYQLNRWSTHRIESRLKELRTAEAAVKKTGIPADTLCAQLFLNIAAKA